MSDWFPVIYGASFEWYLKRMDALLQGMHARCVPLPIDSTESRVHGQPASHAASTPLALCLSAS